MTTSTIHTQPAPQPTRRTRSAGCTEVDTEQIEREAIAAAQAGESLVESCPYPFTSEAGLHFAAVWYLHTTPQASVNRRPIAI